MPFSFETFALAIPCVFHRRVVHEARTVGDYAIALKNTNHPDRKQLGVQLAHALLDKVHPAERAEQAVGRLV